MKRTQRTKGLFTYNTCHMYVVIGHDANKATLRTHVAHHDGVGDGVYCVYREETTLFFIYYIYA